MAIFGFDTETDNDGSRAWVVQWALVPSRGKQRWTGQNVNEFIALLQSFMESRDGHDYIYIANINYDWWFIFDELAAFCQEHLVDVKPIQRNGRIISVDLEPSEDSDLGPYKLSFRDTMAKVPGSSVRSLGKMIGLPKLEGVSEDFHPGWSKETDFSDPAQWEYVIRDAEIVAVAMQKLHSAGRRKATASGDAWQQMKRYIAGDKRYKREFKWEHLFPHLTTDLDLRLRRAYCGGLNISMHPGRHDLDECGAITHEDVHSMYPTVMSYDPLPYGVPTLSDHPPRDGALYIAEVRIRFQLKEGMFPWFQFKNGADYVMEGIPFGTPVEAAYQWHEMALTNVDLDIMSDWYDIEFDPEYQPAYHVFLQRTGVFAGYIEKYMKEKEKAIKGSLEYTSAKLAMNSGYGRMALNREQTVTTLVKDTAFNDDGELTDVYRFMTETRISEDTENYLPYAIFVTSFARARLLENVLQCVNEGKRVFHCDTDSVIHEGLESIEMDHGDHLGGWGIENRPAVLYEGGFKRYIELNKEPPDCLADFNMACAGVPQRCNHLGVPIGMWVELLDDPTLICTHTTLGQEHYTIKSEWLRKLYTDNGMDPDNVNTMKLIGYRVQGGIILRGHQHTLNDGMQLRLRHVF